MNKKMSKIFNFFTIEVVFIPQQINKKRSGTTYRIYLQKKIVVFISQKFYGK